LLCGIRISLKQINPLTRIAFRSPVSFLEPI
jgi:hypothetical protein